VFAEIDQPVLASDSLMMASAIESGMPAL